MSRLGEAEKALEAISKALATFVDEDFGGAKEMAVEAKNVASRAPKVRELLGLCHYRLEEWQEALKELLTYRRLTGALDENHVIADCYRALGRPERALEVCNEVTADALAPEVWTELNIVAAQAHADEGEIERGLARLARSDLNPVSVEPHHLRLWYVQADLLERAGQKGQARRTWERISSEDPGYFDVSERMGTEN